jgi:hypothetical protein
MRVRTEEWHGSAWRHNMMQEQAGDRLTGTKTLRRKNLQKNGTTQIISNLSWSKRFFPFNIFPAWKIIFL